MKKVSILAAVAMATGLASCTAQAPKATLKTDVDSLSYAIGISQTQGLKDYLHSAGVDTAYMADFLKGVNDAANKTSKKDRLICSVCRSDHKWQVLRLSKGINHQLFADDSTMTVNKGDILAGVFAGVLNKDMKMRPEASSGIDSENDGKHQRKSLKRNMLITKLPVRSSLLRIKLKKE